MTTTTAQELLDLVVANAPRLREAGVLRMSLGGDLAFELAPAPATGDQLPADDEPGDAPTDVLRDPWTHGKPGKDAPKAIAPKRTPL